MGAVDPVPVFRVTTNDGELVASTDQLPIFWFLYVTFAV